MKNDDQKTTSARPQGEAGPEPSTPVSVSVEKELSAADILRIPDLKIERVDVPEWGGHIYVRLLSGTGREKYIESVRTLVGTPGKDKNAYWKMVLTGSGAKLVAEAACDKNGKRIFRDEDVEALGKKSYVALKRVVDAAAKLNGLGDDQDDDAKKDSAGRPAPTVDSSTGSQGT
jgi:hypothetical protein